MKLKDILNIDNIKDFIEGNITYFRREVGSLDSHIEEQILWRLSLCSNDCVPNEQCKDCGCPTKKKILVNKSCNNGERFPDMMNKKDWNNYKKEHNIK